MPNRSPDSISIDLADGRVLDAVQPETTGESVKVELIDQIQQHMFQSCPICGDTATDDEHVPPQSIGGDIMTRTCGPCNHQLGSNVEGDLAAWWSNTLTLPRFASSGVPGKRRSGPILLRTDQAGALLFFMNGKYDRDIIDMLKSGQVELTGTPPDPNRYHLALLKHAYLAACMKFGVPQGDAADQVRRDLIAARDAASRHTVPVSRFALGLTVLRLDTTTPIVTAPVVRAIAHEAAGPYGGVVLAGRVFVSWSSRPVENLPAATQREVRFNLQVGGRVDGTVSSVDGS